jgi:hypothetical protein
MWTQRQLDVLSRIWSNLRKGVTKAWALPVIPIPKDGDIELLNLAGMADRDAYYPDFINMLAGLYCAITGFPVDRLGYRASGKGPENTPKDNQTAGTLVDQADPGLPPLLEFLEGHITDYLVRPNWSRLQMRFQGKNPKEDARAYEMRTLSCTWDEKRAMCDMSPVSEAVKGAENKDLAKIMGQAPVDPNLAGVFQAVVSTMLGAKNDEKAAGNEMTSKKDPGTALAHGHEAGVRRDSKGESARAAKKAMTPRSLYVSRQVLNADEILEWAYREGFSGTLSAEDMHVTIAYSRAAVDWFACGESEPEILIPAGGPRIVEPLGPKGAVVLKIANRALSARWSEFLAEGASWDYGGYQPHVTITYAPQEINVMRVTPYTGRVLLGPEIFQEIVEEWVAEVA